MCGIVGYIGTEPASDIIVDTLRRLEYRGYDSAGIVTVSDNQFHLCRAIGKLKNLEKALLASPHRGHIGIGHTRWATHGGVTEANAHPHIADNKVAIVHNGIIENYRQLKDELANAGCQFASETDSEVLAHLFAQADVAGLRGKDALQHVMSRISGAFALAAIFADDPETMLVARNASPLAIGIADDIVCVASDAAAMAHLTRSVIYLKDGDVAVLTKGSAEIWDSSGRPANREIIISSASPILVDKGGYRHFMEKEIHEQPDAIANTLSAMMGNAGKITAGLDEEDCKDITNIVILAAGTSAYAGEIGRYWIEQMSAIPVTVENASEYRYRHPAIQPGGVAIAISQSGESLDTLMALRYAAEQGLKTFAIVNVQESSIAREVDVVLPTRAGPEIGVASTKAFTAQLTVLLSLAIMLGRTRGIISEDKAEALTALLQSVPGAVGQTINQFEQIRPIATELKRASSCLFLGRGRLYPLALEAALKLKELSYIHAEGFAAGEMKHGPIALIEEGLPVICFVDNDPLSEKTLSNLKEAQARGATIITIASQTISDEIDFADYKIVINDYDPVLSPLIMAVPAQLLAYYTASEKGTDVDQPRNLAKSVTVE